MSKVLCVGKIVDGKLIIEKSLNGNKEEQNEKRIHQ